MAVSCFKNGFQENLFISSHRAYLGPRDAMPHHGEGSVEDAMRTEAGRTKLEVNEKIGESRLLPASVEHLNKLIEESSPSQAEVILDNLDVAISELKAIEGLRDMLSDEDYAIAMRQFDSKYSDFIIDSSEIKELAKVRLEASQRIKLMEAHKVTDVEKLKTYALLFVRDSSGMPLSLTDRSIPDGETFTVDFKDVKTGVVNDFAKRYLTLGMILEAVGRDSIHVSNRTKSRPAVTAYLWPDHRTYDKPMGSTSKSYVEVLDNYELTTTKKETPSVANAPAPENTPQEPYSNGFEDARGYMPDEEYEQAQAEDEAAARRGELSYHRRTEIYTGTNPSSDVNLSLSPSESASASDVITLDSLKGKSVEVPEHFQGENSYEQIAKIKYLENGETVYNAIRMMAAIHREVQGPIDNRTMWKNLRGGLISKGGNWEISFNEMAKAVYGKNENKIDDSLPYMKEFKAAAKDMLETLDKTEDKGPDADSYRAQRERVKYPEEKKDMERVTGTVFDRNSYGAPVSLNVFQLIGFAISKKDRPTITEDSWMKEAATSKAARGYETYGEQEVISHARAFDKMMAVGSKEEYLTLANNYIAMGSSLMETQHHRGYFGKVKFEGDVDVAPLTMKNLNDPTFKMMEAQIMAIRYGAMYFAAAELGVYQKVEAEKKQQHVDEIAAELATSIVEKTAAGEELTQEQKDQLMEETRRGIQGILGGYAAVSPGEDAAQWQAGVEAGVKIPLLDKQIPGRLSLQWTISAGTLVPVIRTTAGLVYNVDFGKNGRWHAEAYAQVVWGLSDPSGYIGPNFGGGISYDLTADRTVAVGAGASVGLREDGNLASVHLSVDRNLDRVLQKKVSEFKGLHETELGELRKEVYGKIDALVGVDPVQKGMLKAQYEKYMDYRIAYDETKNFTKWYRQIKLISVGVTATVGVEEGGFAIGPYITFGVGFRARTLYVPPLETPEQVAYSKKTGLPSGIENYKAPEADWIEVVVDDQQLWDGDTATKDEALALAETERSNAFDAVRTGVADDIEMTEGNRFTNIDFKKLNGTVRLYTDGRSGIETIREGDQELALNLDSADNLVVRILEIPASQGGDNVVVIGITNDPSASLDDIVANSGNYLSWNQTLDGKKSNSELLNNPGAASAPDMIMSRVDAEIKIHEGTMALGDLSKDGAKQNVRSIQYSDLRQRAEREEASERFSERQKEIAGEIATELLAAGFDYNVLIQSAKKSKIDAKITELYAARDISPEPALINLVHQYAMEQDRPQKDHIPLAWNIRAIEQKLGKSVGDLNIQYWKDHEQEMKDGGLKGAFPEGSEFMVTINENGDVTMLGGYYNHERYGDVLAPVLWNASNPEATLTAMGVELTEENKEKVIGISESISKLNWEEKPLPGNADFKTAMNTMTGDKLLTTACSNDLYGSEDGETLREMARSGDTSTNPTLAREYAEDVAELLANKQAMIRGNPVVIDWEVYSGLDNKCFNLTFARNVKLVYEKPEKKVVKAASTREKIENGMTQEMQVKYNTFRIAPGLIPVSIGSEVATPAQTAIDEQHPLTPGQVPSDLLGTHPTDETDQNTSF